MNLYLFPSIPNANGGYEIAVNDAYTILKPQKKDVVVWLSNARNTQCLSDEYFINQNSFFSFHTLLNVLQGKFSTEVSEKKLCFLQKYEFNKIHCDEVCFYRAIKSLFPKKQFSVRFHNCFARIRERSKVLKVKTDWRFTGKMKILSKLEQEIFNDRFVHKIFLSNEDAAYYNLITKKNDYSILTGKIVTNKNTVNEIKNKIVWFGGVESHKLPSLVWFIKDVFPLIKKQIPNVEFYLYGNNTTRFNNPLNSIYGYGFHTGNDLPYKGQALFINPDIIGGGIKIKLRTYFKEGVSFISTPFGFEGYNENLIDNKYCFVVEKENWAKSIIDILSES
ncbi:hypothetical protein FACS189438_0520 [Bacteroidia bacterium]|nr:hypothetical protein FACS189438_0520 [Bacteroidia bacterium]